MRLWPSSTAKYPSASKVPPPPGDSSAARAPSRPPPPLHAPLAVVNGEISLGIEGAPSPRVLERGPDSLTRATLRRWPLYGGIDDGGQIPGEVVHVREPRENVLGRG